MGQQDHRRFLWLQMFKLEHGAMRVTPAKGPRSACQSASATQISVDEIHKAGPSAP